jgi:hypothetical protein
LPGISGGAGICVVGDPPVGTDIELPGESNPTASGVRRIAIPQLDEIVCIASKKLIGNLGA